MSTLDLDVIEQRASKATPGPWAWQSGKPDGPAFVETVDALAETGEGNLVAEVFTGETGKVLETFDPQDENADFIAAARSDVPALCAEVRRLRMTPESLSAIRDALGRFLADADYMGLSKDEAQDYRDALKSVEALS